MGGSHARLGPSGSSRWVNCPGSIREEVPYPDISGAAAKDGVGSHLLLELCLINKRKAVWYQGKRIGVGDEDAPPNGWLVRPDRVKRVQLCLDYVSDKVKQYGEAGFTCEVEAETESNPGKFCGRDDWKGTCDILIKYLKNGVLCIVETIDFKDGRGYVSEKSNTQLVSYNLGKGYLTEAYEFVITIVQPKTKNPIRSETLDALQMHTWFNKLAKAADATDAPDAPLVAGKHCQWCKHKAKCTVRGETDLTFLNIDVEGASDNELEKAWDQAKIIKEKLSAIEQEIKNRNGVGSWVYGEGKANYKFNVTEAKVKTALKGLGFKPSQYEVKKLVTPAALRKLDMNEELKEQIEELITNEPSKQLFKTNKLTAKQLFAEELK